MSVSNPLLHSPKPLGEYGGFETFYSDHPANHWIGKPDLISVNAVVADILHIGETEMQTPQYCKVAIERFIRFNNISANIFIRLSKDKFIKIINAGEEYSEEIVHRYRKRGAHYFYIRRDSFVNFCDNYSDVIHRDLAKSNISATKRVDVELNGISFVHEEVLNLGLTSSSVETLDAVVDSNIKQMRKNPLMTLLLENMVRNKNYQYEHSLMISYIAMAISMKMQWHTQQTLEKLSLAALMHDVVIEDKAISEDHDLNPENIQNSRWRTLELIKNHPLNVASLIDEMKNIPADVSNIVLTHHEKADGSGYPRGLSANQISPLNCVFILSEEITSEIFRQKGKPIDKDSLIHKMEECYDKGNFRSVMAAVKDVFLK